MARVRDLPEAAATVARIPLSLSPPRRRPFSPHYLTMADAKARAEARRKAILARGGDRLARITTSARGEDGAAYMKDGTSLQSLLVLFLSRSRCVPRDSPVHAQSYRPHRLRR